MSLPRIIEFFPRMKVRGKGRKALIRFWDQDFNLLDVRWVRTRRGTFRLPQGASIVHNPDLVPGMNE